MSSPRTLDLRISLGAEDLNAEITVIRNIGDNSLLVGAKAVFRLHLLCSPTNWINFHTPSLQQTPRAQPNDERNSRSRYSEVPRR
jgi:hypothetical protein